MMQTEKAGIGDALRGLLADGKWHDAKAVKAAVRERV